MKKILSLLFICLSVAIINPIAARENAGFATDITVAKLIAPSGVKLARSLPDLQEKMNAVLFKSFKKAINYKITKIEYVPSQTGLGALVYYETKDKKTGNIFFAKNLEFKTKKDVTSTDAQKNISDKVDAEGYLTHTAASETETYKCLGSCFCQVVLVIRDDGNGGLEYLIDCTCSTCLVGPGDGLQDPL